MPFDNARSLKPTVRNPLLKLPAMLRLIAYLGEHPELRAIVIDLLTEIGTHCRVTAELSWRKHKAPMAVYWKVCGVYVGHVRRAIKKGS